MLSLTTKRRSEFALRAAIAGLEVDPDNIDLQKLLKQSEKAVAIEKRKEEEARERQYERETKWTEAWNIANKRQAVFGHPSDNWHHPPQLSSPLPYYAQDDTSEMTDHWPVVVLYPQHRQLDVIQGVNPSTMLVMLLAEMFPEPEDDNLNRPTVHWDVNHEYFISNLSVYIHLSSCSKFNSCEEWLDYNRIAVKRR